MLEASAGSYTVSVSDAIFKGNLAGNGGGALALGSGVTGLVDHSVFEGNTASGLGNDYGGGAIFAEVLTVTDSSFSGNISEMMDGGAIHVTGSLTLAGNNVFTGNSSTSGNGGAVALREGGSLTVNADSEVTFSENEATNGGAVYMAGGASSAFTNNGTMTFDGNNAATNGGAV